MNYLVTIILASSEKPYWNYNPFRLSKLTVGARSHSFSFFSQPCKRRKFLQLCFRACRNQQFCSQVHLRKICFLPRRRGDAEKNKFAAVLRGSTLIGKKNQPQRSRRSTKVRSTASVGLPRNSSSAVPSTSPKSDLRFASEPGFVPGFRQFAGPRPTTPILLCFLCSSVFQRCWFSDVGDSANTYTPGARASSPDCAPDRDTARLRFFHAGWQKTKENVNPKLASVRR